MIKPIDKVRRWWWKTGGNGNGGPHAGPPHANRVAALLSAESPAHPDSAADAPPQPAPAPEPPWLTRLDAAGVPRSLVYPSTTLARLLDQTADRFGDSTALVYGDRHWTYRELLASVNRMAGGLAGLGVRRGERVLIVLPNCPEFVVAFFAVQKLGAVVVNAGPLMGMDDVRQVLTMTTPHVAIGLDLQAPLLGETGRRSTLEHWVWVSLQEYQPVFKRLGYQFKLWHNRNGHHSGATHHLLHDLLEHAPARPPTIEPDRSATAVLQPTGGTTGTLKLAELTHRSLLANAAQASTLMNCRPGQDRVMAVLPMFHVYGLTLGLVSAVYSASSMIVATRFAADQVLDLVRRHKPTVFPLVPAICDALSDRMEQEERDRKDKDKKAPPRPTKLDGLRLCLSGAAPLPQATAERFERLTGARVLEGYGLTEASPVTHANLPALWRVGSIGLPLPDTRVRVVDFDTGRDVAPGEPGEMLICAPQVMAGYFGNADATEQALVTDARGDVWLRTGDVVRYDADGFFYVLDRMKDMVIRSGLKIYPGKVEKVLRTHPKVADAAVVGRPDPVHTETVVAVVVLKDVPEGDARFALVDELRALCRLHLAPYEVPAVIEFRDALPRSPLGKLLKRELRKAPPLPAAPPVAAPSNGTPGGDGQAAPNGNGHGNGNGNGNANVNAGGLAVHAKEVK